MSEITQQIKDYRAGKTTWDTLVSQLTDRTYEIPERYRTDTGAPTDPWLKMDWFDQQPSYTDGTYDEVYRARDTGLLTQDEYMEISRIGDEKHPK